LSRGPLVAVNLAGLPESLAYAELFGHAAGAFTGAIKEHGGAVGQARHGVLFLDEIGDIPPHVQLTLLRFLDTGEYRPLGANVSLMAETQVVTATNADLHRLVREGLFRADLLNRLNGVVVSLPPLRDRLDDIPLLVRAFLRKRGLPPVVADVLAGEALQEKDWPGNVRQLWRVVDRFALLSLTGGGTPEPWWPDPDPVGRGTAADDNPTLNELRREFDRRVLQDRLRRFAGNTTATAQSLGISRRSVYDLARRLGVVIQGEAP
jgi:DNA-binding NtrC family response regulator